jgi:hypothetical protein
MSLRDRILLAFIELEALGWFAKADWQCCQSCGRAAVPEDHEGPIVFFHAQDAETLDSAQPRCHITFSHTDEADPAIKAVGDQLVAALRAEGCTVTWNGSIETRPEVSL